jgi:hypothetical protein
MKRQWSIYCYNHSITHVEYFDNITKFHDPKLRGFFIADISEVRVIAVLVLIMFILLLLCFFQRSIPWVEWVPWAFLPGTNWFGRKNDNLSPFCAKVNSTLSYTPLTHTSSWHCVESSTGTISHLPSYLRICWLVRNYIKGHRHTETSIQLNCTPVSFFFGTRSNFILFLKEIWSVKVKLFPCLTN